ncbi:hypothetical protein [Thalassospira sp. TSL5-1]|uniref:hypothetical protein n=1 Tax=Thalassospira sp. TSL5-1 TaxID=1544451 RepID=UPI00093C9E10|nr:hypothetical protein [Thalassospira sp. TSL5-1]OKH87070.1 hypothetical protein LF95_18935 [Thalassospira sp. TSL5-1]
MNFRKLWFGLVVFVVAVLLFLKNINSTGPFVIIPDPLFSMFEDYSPDKEKMADYYAGLFNGREAEYVIFELDRYDVRYFFEGGNRIEFEVSKSFFPVPARYSGFVMIEFKDGVFDRVISIGYFGLVTP